jgi:hypothetical protein
MMAKLADAILQHIVKYQASFKSKNFIFDMMTKSNKIMIDAYTLEGNTLTVKNKKYFSFVPGRLFTLSEDDNPSYYYTVVEVINRQKYIIELTNIQVQSGLSKLASVNDTFTLTKGMIANYYNNPIETTLGKFFVNSYLLAYLFNDMFEYNNGTFKYSKYEKQICKKVIDGKITVDDTYRYIDRLTFLDTLTPIFMPNITKGLITLDPEVKKLINDLLREYKDQLSDPNIMIMIEDKIIEADKASMKDDPSMGYASGKTFNVHRKRMFHGFGVMESFGDVETTISFLTSNLDDGWKKDELVKLFNDVRKGISSRALDTAKGGASAKELVRTFQSSIIAEDDCGTTEGITNLKLTNENKEEYLYSYIIDKSGKNVLLTDDNIDSYIGKDFILRSPMYCKSKGSTYCFKCFGEKYKKLNQVRLVSEPLKVGSTFLTLALEKMHGVKASIHDLDLDKFVI